MYSFGNHKSIRRRRHHDLPPVRSYPTSRLQGGFFPQALEKGLRSEQGLTLALAEMYVRGFSTRNVTAIVEKLCGSSVSSRQVSRATQLLDDTLTAWRQRPVGEIVYLYLSTFPCRPVPCRRRGWGKVDNCSVPLCSCPLFPSPDSHPCQPTEKPTPAIM